MLSDDTPHAEPARRRIDVIASAGFLDDLDGLDTAEVRRRREMCGEVERELSYYRRLLHGRLDLLAFERRRRSGEETRELLDVLPEILGDTQGVTGGHVTVDGAELAPPDFAGRGRRSIDFVLGDDFLTRLSGLDDAELDTVGDTLTAEERTVSSQRAIAHRAYDTLGVEIGRRYRQGITSVDELFPN